MSSRQSSKERTTKGGLASREGDISDEEEADQRS
jgi:hypothetical protein